MTTAAPTAIPMPAAQRRQIIDGAATEFVGHGWRIESRTDYQAVFVKGHRPNHILHLILSIVTVGLWIPVWIVVSITSGEKRQIVSVDEYGQRHGR